MSPKRTACAKAYNKQPRLSGGHFCQGRVCQVAMGCPKAAADAIVRCSAHKQFCGFQLASYVCKKILQSESPSVLGSMVASAWPSGITLEYVSERTHMIYYVRSWWR